MKTPKSLAEQIAGLDDPAPRDFDPEDYGDPTSIRDESSSGSDDGEFDGREHYEAVEKSQLRGREAPTLGPQYVGSRVSRNAVLQDDGDEDDRFIGNGARQDSLVSSENVEDEDDGKEEDNVSQDSGHSNEEENELEHDARNGKVKGIRNRVSSSRLNEDDQMALEASSFHGFSADEESNRFEGASEGEDDLDDDDDYDDNELATDEDEDEDMEDEDMIPRDQSSNSRAELRKMMSEEQKTVVQSIAEATRADAIKGRAVKQQRKAYDALLNTRIRLQKALIAINTLPVAQTSTNTEQQPDKDAFAVAEESALRLWTQLNDLRHDLQSPNASSTEPPSLKRKFEVDLNTPLTNFMTEMQSAEKQYSQTRLRTLDKWSTRVRGPTSHTLSRKLHTPTREPTLSDVLHDHLTNMDRLIKRTRIPRSCAPIQSQRGQHEASEIYDDADFYQLQLKELVDQRMLDSVTIEGGGGGGGGKGGGQSTPWSAMREAKTKKRVDTKASKGRKIRYVVQEKLQNFMVPEDRGSWGTRQTDELFGSLLGQRMRLDEIVDDDEMMMDGDQEDVDVAEQGLMLFRS
ncbi:MAG: hypothetical protein M1823_002607 [Watsoniomyces obsoletus]|nr:MAG: hypothetical protein M1823_002607 [Watsoniomyces obsoletus]